jgi:hypothetical protein
VDGLFQQRHFAGKDVAAGFHAEEIHAGGASNLKLIMLLNAAFQGSHLNLQAVHAMQNDSERNRISEKIFG